MCKNYNMCKVDCNRCDRKGIYKLFAKETLEHIKQLNKQDKAEHNIDEFNTYKEL